MSALTPMHPDVGNNNSLEIWRELLENVQPADAARRVDCKSWATSVLWRLPCNLSFA